MLKWAGEPAGETGGPTNYNLIVHADTGKSWARFTADVAAWKQTSSDEVEKPVYDKEWHHLAATYDKKFIRNYVDGKLESETKCTDTPDTNDAPLIIGSWPGWAETVKGTLDEVGLFSEGLSADDILTIMDESLEVASAVSPAGKLATAWGKIKAKN